MAIRDNELWDRVLTIMGADPDDRDTWPKFDDITYDYYDHSFELIGAGPDVEFTLEMCLKFKELGFHQAWIVRGDRRSYEPAVRDETYYNFRKLED